MSADVLVVEDDVMVREVICEVLSRSGFSAKGCRTGEEALSLSSRSCFDAFIIDHFLPLRTGTETTADLRIQCPDPVIIGISGSHDGGNFIAAGGDLFLKKPFDLVDMVEYLQSQLS